MKVKLIRIGLPTTSVLRNNAKLSRFPVEFCSTECSGKAELCVTHSSTPVNIQSIQRRFQNDEFDFSLDVEKVSGFSKILASGTDRVSPRGQGVFEFEGRLINGLTSGEGYVFQTGGILLMIPNKWIPPNLMVEEGDWVKFTAEGLQFWVT